MLSVIMKAIITSVIIYLLTLLLSRIIGHKLVSQMTYFDYIVGIMIGTAAVNAATIKNNQALSSAVTLVIISLMTLLIDIAHINSMKFRRLVNSQPVVIIEKGKIIDKNMRRVRLTLDEMNMMLREKNFFNISDVESAILESDGKLSVQGKSEKQPLTPSDISLAPAYKGLTRDVIMDGTVMEDNLKYIGKNEHWLKKQLLDYGVHDISEVFYAGLDSSGNFYVSKRQYPTEEPGEHGIE
jgi:uncharacterized membrane protein YcaP (DUF421 family)